MMGTQMMSMFALGLPQMNFTVTSSTDTTMTMYSVWALKFPIWFLMM